MSKPTIQIPVIYYRQNSVFNEENYKTTVIKIYW